MTRYITDINQNLCPPFKTDIFAFAYLYSSSRLSPMDTKTPNLEIRFRTYRDSDAEAVRELFKDSITVGGAALSLHLTLST